MDNPAVHFATVFMAFFAIMNPIVNAPLFLGITEGEDERTLRQVALRAPLLAFCIVATFTLLGRQIFDLFGITLPAFRIAGGLLVGLVGYRLLQGEVHQSQAPSAEDMANSQDAALSLVVSPLTIPLLAGPGTIATAMNFSVGTSWLDLGRVLAALAIVCLLNFVAFDSAQKLVRWLGQNVIGVVSRLMGLILAVIGVQMVIDGVRGVVAG